MVRLPDPLVVSLPDPLVVSLPDPLVVSLPNHGREEDPPQRPPPSDLVVVLFRRLAVLDRAPRAELVRRRRARDRDDAPDLAAHLAPSRHLDLAPVERALLRRLLHLAPFRLRGGRFGTTRPRDSRRSTRFS